MKKENVVQEKSMAVLAVVKPSEPPHCFIAEKERAKYWDALWATFWAEKWGWK